MFGGRNVKLPGDPNFDASKLASEYGVFVYSPRGPIKPGSGPNDRQTVYINLGWFEDNFLNREFGFSDSIKNLTNKTVDASKNDENNIFAKYNSRNSYITYDEGLHKRMRYMEYDRLNWIYPETWGQGNETPTYNGLVGMVPDDRIDQMKEFGYWDEDYFGIANMDKTEKRIPLREIFISTEIIKDSI